MGRREEKEVSFLQEILHMSVYLLVVLVVTYLIIHFVGQRTIVNGVSMETTLYHNDNLIVDKISYRIGDPERFDVVVFPFADDKFFIKRVIGLPGETVQIDEDGNIYINGEMISEHYGYETLIDPGRAINPVELGEDEYFLMGDNRNNSMDSRDERVGNVHRSQLIGKAWLRLYPFDKIGLVDNIK